MSIWPYNGNWNGLGAEALPEIMSSLAIAFNERRVALFGNNTFHLGGPLLFTTGTGNKNWPLASDFYDIPINGSVMSTFMTQISDRTLMLVNEYGFASSGANDEVGNNNSPELCFAVNAHDEQILLSNATAIEEADIQPTALCSNFWMRLQNIYDACYTFKIFVNNDLHKFHSPVIFTDGVQFTKIASTANAAWNDLEEDYYVNVRGRIEWYIFYTINYRARVLMGGELKFDSTEKMSGDVVGGKLYYRYGTDHLINPQTFVLQGEDITIQAGTADVADGELVFFDWVLGDETVITYSSAERPVDTPFNREVVWPAATGLGHVRFCPSGFINTEPYPSTARDYTTYGATNVFDGRQCYLVLDVTSEISDKDGT